MPDFREPAVAASAALLAQHPNVDPTEAGVSYCIRAEEGGPEILRASTRRAVIAMVLGIGGIIIGGIIAIISKSRGMGSEGENFRLAMAALFSGGGFAILFGHVALERRRTRRRVAERLGGSIPTDIVCVPVDIENSLTHHQLKFTPEDSAIMMLFPDLHCMQIEGTSHRYLLHAADVQSITLSAGGQHSSFTLHIAYRIEGTSLALALRPNRILGQMWSQFSGRVPPLYDQVRACLRA